MKTTKHRFQSDEIRIDPGKPRFMADSEDKSYVITMGTGTPSPNPYRNGPAGAVVAGERPYLIDAGEGIVRSIAKASAAFDNRFADCFAPGNLTHLFITHLHSDHVTGLPSLMLNSWIFGRETPMEIYGPAGTKNLVSKLLEAYEVDIEDRLNALDKAPEEGWKVNVHEISGDGLVMKDGNAEVHAFRHYHGGMDNFGYRFITEDKTIVWAGDGQCSDSFFKNLEDADILVTELCTEQNIAQSPWGGATEEEKDRVIWSYHMKPSKLAEMAQSCGVGKVVLIHESNYSQPYDPEALYREFSELYEGAIVSSRDSDVL